MLLLFQLITISQEYVIRYSTKSLIFHRLSFVSFMLSISSEPILAISLSDEADIIFSTLFHQAPQEQYFHFILAQTISFALLLLSNIDLILSYSPDVFVELNSSEGVGKVALTIWLLNINNIMIIDITLFIIFIKYFNYIV
ncbi:TPA: hypothetical protein DEG21_03335 [Patescibacteria group bacterium]|nr:hypothetical protein [Candidatus Gracilibacteria bacterium]HBY74892.1 hypothetical protein [Candidatus Gracilibacteria bacterium]